jgi:hypothetical protein
MIVHQAANLADPRPEAARRGQLIEQMYYPENGRAQVAPTIDGSASGCPDELPALAADTARQLLRGAGVWHGPEVDSHAVRLMWDDDNVDLHDERPRRTDALARCRSLLARPGDRDAFYLQPVTARRVLEHPGGPVITLTYDVLTGDVTWVENDSGN